MEPSHWLPGSKLGTKCDQDSSLWNSLLSDQAFATFIVCILFTNLLYFIKETDYRYLNCQIQIKKRGTFCNMLLLYTVAHSMTQWWGTPLQNVTFLSSCFCWEDWWSTESLSCLSAGQYTGPQACIPPATARLSNTRTCNQIQGHNGITNITKLQDFTDRPLQKCMFLVYFCSA